MSVVIFSSKREAEIIAAGGFYCLCCLQGKSIEDQSEDPRYCKDCRSILKADKPVTSTPDIWLKDNSIFVHYGKQYVLTPGLSTICLDEVSDIATDGGQTTQGKDSVRHKISCDTSQGQELTQKAIKGRRKPLDLPVALVLELSASGKSIREVADETLISRETVRRIVNGQRHPCRGYSMTKRSTGNRQNEGLTFGRHCVKKPAPVGDRQL